MAAGFPFHVVVEWMGHSAEVARQNYLKVDERDLTHASETPIGGKVTQNMTQSADSSPDEQAPKENTPSEPIDSQGVT